MKTKPLGFTGLIVAIVTIAALVANAAERRAIEKDAAEDDFDLSYRLYPASGLTGSRGVLTLECYHKKTGAPFLVGEVAGTVVTAWRSSTYGFSYQTNTFRKNIVVDTRFAIKSEISWGGDINSVARLNYRKLRVYYTDRRPLPTF